ncbi:MAG TPA: hypothetical protein VHO95_13750 [Candidatus Dormibacteraeota bacterium]|nr:hypothetical protein [Candidatus Dormibacteraeota bacterium]
MSDRAVQDRVIRALADAPFRASPAWRAAGLADGERVERYARFLARHFYHERIVHFFKYSRALAPLTGRTPESVLRSAAFDALLPTVVLGSRETARAVASLVTRHLQTSPAPVPYVGDLVRYEEAMMVVEAGPRVWRDAAGVAPTAGGERRAPAPLKVDGTTLLELAHDLPAVLPALLGPWTDVPEAPQRPTTLLVARSPHGRVAVARSDARIAAVLALADGTRTLAELAAGAGLSVGELEATVAGLVDLGAIRFWTGS